MYIILALFQSEFGKEKQLDVLLWGPKDGRLAGSTIGPCPSMLLSEGARPKAMFVPLEGSDVGAELRVENAAASALVFNSATFGGKLRSNGRRLVCIQ
mmetsp:Transcript_1788/g.2545  ORF Transcript_1788/g.2545 Transcript_1788/m.2545 type:complete len:98 (-) Transcript_1788:1034-1327(-)